MDEETQKIIAEQMKSLPADVKAAIISVDYQTKLQEITRRQKLLIDQAGKLEMETTLVMIGLEPLTDFTANIQREMGLTTIRAQEVAMDVSENIFKPIRDSLQTMNETVGKEEEIGPNDVQEEGEPEEPVTKFTNSNEANLNRDQILNEIENPETIDKGDQSMKFVKQNPEIIKQPTPVTSTELEVRPTQALETVPNQNVKDITKDKSVNVFESKMAGPTIISRQIEEIKTETKLPEAKNRPSSGVDPYREPLG
jgi:hypothetical protein